MQDSQPKEDDAVQDLEIWVQVDKLKLLYQHSYPAVLVSALAAIVMVSMLWNAQERSVLYSWLGLIFFTAFLRSILFFLYWRRSPQGQAVLAWETPYFITLMLTTLTWGVGGLYIMPADSEIHQTLVYSVLIGFSGGAFSYYSAHRTMTIMTIATILLPPTLWFIVRGNLLMLKLALFALLFFVSAVRASKGFSNTLHQNFLMNHELELAKKKAEKLARIDELTNLYNRRAFYENGKLLVDQCQRNGKNISVIVMDIDKFKMINDTFGHATGDKVLEHVSEFLQDRLRKTDITARIGGEEFGILLSTGNLDVAKKVAEELREGIAESNININGEKIQVTASFGLTSGDSDIELLVKHADMAMYRAKDAGRNCVVSF